LNLAARVVEYLENHQGEKLTARQLAQWVMQAYPVECQAKKAASWRVETDPQLLDQLAAEIGAQYRRSLQPRQIKRTESRPKKYYWSGQSDSDEVVVAESGEIQIDRISKVASAPATPSTTRTVKEEAKEKVKAVKPQIPMEVELYPLLCDYLGNEFGLYCKRIEDRTSSNKGGQGSNHWLHPDLVGMEDLSKDWAHEVREAVSQYLDKRTKLWSFEVKRLVNRSNVRESFFQAVSNSSWANFGYLVAAEIAGADIGRELRMLCAAHGIGVIQLNQNDPMESQIMIPAREREAIDWEMVNRLVSENRDFHDYIKLVKEFYQTGNPRKKDWDNGQSLL